MPKVKSKSRYFNKLILKNTNSSLCLINAVNVEAQSKPQISNTSVREEGLPAVVNVCDSNIVGNEASTFIPSSSKSSPQSNFDKSNFSTTWSTYAKTANSEANSNISDDIFVDESHSNIQLKLASWAIKENIPHSSLKKLICILKSEKDISQFQKLPSDPRTLLKTPRAIAAKEMEPGYFYYFGVTETTKKLLKQYNYVIPSYVDSIEIAVNIDGLPISNSSSDCLWPILIQPIFNELKNAIGMVALYYGKEKPKSVNNYLREFVNECIELSNNGIIIENNKYNFKVKMLVCDAPAKSYCLSIKGHAGHHSCTKCTSEGEMVNNILCFSEVRNLRKRTDNEFRTQLDEDHHTDISVLTRLPNFNLIDDVVLDYMHLVCLGVMKKFLTNKRFGWVFGKQPFKLPYSEIERASKHLMDIKPFVPVEFARKTRNLQECKRYKATELRLLLLYTGPVIFKKIHKPHIYNNFLTLSVAICILCRDDFVKIQNMVDYANSLLNCFVEVAINLYGVEFVSHNVHNLLHLTDDVSRFGNLSLFSAFPFENYMQIIKKMLRTGHKPLQQIVHRVLEGRFYKEQKIESTMSVLQEHFDGPLLDDCRGSQHRVLKMPNFTLKLNLADCYVLMNNNDIIRIYNIVLSSRDTILIIGRVFEEKEPFFDIPCNSTNLGIFQVDTSKISPLKVFELSDIQNKMFYMPFEGNQAVIFPLLHN